MTETVGHRLRDARRRRGWSQQRLAYEAGLGHATPERCERGEATPRLANLEAMARALEIRPAWLITGEEPMVTTDRMTVAGQFDTYTASGTEGQPGFVIVEPGPWERDVDDEWRAVDASEGR